MLSLPSILRGMDMRFGGACGDACTIRRTKVQQDDCISATIPSQIQRLSKQNSWAGVVPALVAKLKRTNKAQLEGKPSRTI
jgi:hypothetical protein